MDKKQYPEDPPSAPLPDYYCYWSTDGNVYAMQMVGNTLYLGGNFSKLYPNTGYGVI